MFGVWCKQVIFWADAVHLRTGGSAASHECRLCDVGIKTPRVADCPVAVKEAGANDDGVVEFAPWRRPVLFEDAGQSQGSLTANSGGPIPCKVAASNANDEAMVTTVRTSSSWTAKRQC